MKPSDFSTSSTRARRREPGVDTVPRRRCFALRMRVSISPRGSFMDMRPSPLPARLHEAGDEALRPEFPERDARQAELAIDRARPARHLAAVADARRVRVAR